MMLFVGLSWLPLASCMPTGWPAMWRRDDEASAVQMLDSLLDCGAIVHRGNRVRPGLFYARRHGPRAACTGQILGCHGNAPPRTPERTSTLVFPQTSIQISRSREGLVEPLSRNAAARTDAETDGGLVYLVFVGHGGLWGIDTHSQGTARFRPAATSDSPVAKSPHHRCQQRPLASRHAPGGPPLSPTEPWSRYR